MLGRAIMQKFHNDIKFIFGDNNLPKTIIIGDTILNVLDILLVDVIFCPYNEYNNSDNKIYTYKYKTHVWLNNKLATYILLYKQGEWFLKSKKIGYTNI